MTGVSTINKTCDIHMELTRTCHLHIEGPAIRIRENTTWVIAFLAATWTILRLVGELIGQLSE